nr:iron-containing alcohol dehydrogenase [Rubrobacter marinus]
MGTNRGNGHETIFTMEATPVKYGPGSSEEVGWELKRMRVGRVMLVSDPGVVASGITPRIRELIEAEGIEVELWDGSRVEPTADSFQAAADFAREGNFDGFVAVGAAPASTPPKSPTS